MIRVWIANNGLHCSINVGVYGDRESFAWGIITADLMRHAANAIALRKGTDNESVLSEIKQGLFAELDHPTSDTPGGFV
jgi:hypothetical protein